MLGFLNREINEVEWSLVGENFESGNHEDCHDIVTRKIPPSLWSHVEIRYGYDNLGRIHIPTCPNIDEHFSNRFQIPLEYHQFIVIKSEFEWFHDELLNFHITSSHIAFADARRVSVIDRIGSLESEHEKLELPDELSQFIRTEENKTFIAMEGVWLLFNYFDTNTFFPLVMPISEMVGTKMSGYLNSISESIEESQRWGVVQLSFYLFK